MSQPSDLPMSVPQDFSNLEVNFQRTDEGFKEVRLAPSDVFKEVHRVDHSSGLFYDESRTAVNSLPSAPSWISIEPDKEGPAIRIQQKKRIYGLPTKAFWLLLALIITGTAVAVGVPVGLYVHKRSTTSSASTGSSLTAAPNSSSGSPTNPSSLPASPSSRDASPGLASVAWNDTNGVAQYRVYFQDDKLSIKESAWNASSNVWRESQTIGTARVKTPITAAVTGPQDFDFGLSVYAIGENGSIIEWTSKDSNTFVSGNMTDQNIVPANVSSLTALWDRHHGCPQCANTLLFAYERNDGQLEIGNFTQHGWDWTTLQSSPASGTGLALTLRWQSTASGDIRLFYQTKDGHLVSQDFNGPRNPPSFTWLSREAQPVAQLASISPLTTFTWGSTSNGDALYNDMISANATGLAVNYWDGIYGTNGKGTVPSALASVEAVAVAAHADKHVYALQANGTIAEFEMLDQEYQWAYVGSVATG